MTMFSSQWFANPASGFDTTLIGNSVWLDGSADYLTKTWGSAGNRTRWTMAWWFQLNAIATDMTFFSANDGTSDFYIRMDGTSNQNMTIVDNNASMNVNTTAMQRDIAWYHCIISYDSNEGAEADRISIYINGVAMALTTAGDAYPSSGGETYWNNDQANEIGRRSRTTSSYANAYMTQICFLDGQSIQNSDVTVASFLDTQTFGDNGSQKIPKEDSSVAALATAAEGNSFCLDFANSSALGNDISDEENDFTPSSMAAANQTTNTPSLVYPVWNDLEASATLSNGNLNARSTTSQVAAQATQSVSSGKFYWEITANTSADQLFGITGEAVSYANRIAVTFSYTPTVFFYGVNGNLYVNGTSSSWDSAISVDDVIGIAVDFAAGKIWFAKNNTWLQSGDPANGTSPASTFTVGTFTPSWCAGGASGDRTGATDFGQLGFTYTPPTNFVSLTSSNLTAPSYQGIDYFKPLLYAGNGTAIGSGGKAVTGTGFQPDFVWMKNRDAIDSHGLYDAVRGTTKQIESDTATAETTESEGLTAFGSDGFTVGSLAQLNTSSENYVAWQWLGANGTSTNEVGTLTSTVSVAGADHFSIVSYTGSGANTTVGHGLGAAPEMMICRELPGGDDWNVYHKDNTSSPAGVTLRLDTTGATTTDSTLWNSTVPSSTIVNLGTSAETNQDSTAMILYCFRSVAGVCKVGAYTGNGAIDGPCILTGFAPSFVLVKPADAANPWTITDIARDTYNPTSKRLHPNSSAVEETDSITAGDMLADGFKIRSSHGNVNQSGITFIYLAISDIGGGGTLPPIYGR